MTAAVEVYYEPYRTGCGQLYTASKLAFAEYFSPLAVSAGCVKGFAN